MENTDEDPEWLNKFATGFADEVTKQMKFNKTVTHESFRSSGETTDKEESLGEMVLNESIRQEKLREARNKKDREILADEAELAQAKGRADKNKPVTMR